MRCSNCNSPLPKNAKFCSNCGQPIEQNLNSKKEDRKLMESAPYVHDSDRAALKALMAIPGFTPALKAFMKIWNERQFRIVNMSGRIRIDEKQLPEYYDMLPPICEKLRINIPSLYLELSPVANAYTSGDNDPFIVITSGLLETIPHELIPTVLAHECGHIDCHHVLYSTMGSILLNGGLEVVNIFSGLGNFISTPLKIAFYYWMRCSEFSADRAAILYNGGYEEMAKVCMCLAGFDKDIQFKSNLDRFMKQAEDYQDIVKTSNWDKTLEFLALYRSEHPLLAVRAYEAREWVSTEQF